MNGVHSIVQGDVLEVLRALPDCSFDALLCDPPYGFSFMGKRWDYDVPSVDVWREALRVLKPGAPLLAFGGARTFHRIAVGIEDAGFELRDVLMWLYGKGFPKSHDIAKAIDKDAGAERAVVGTVNRPAFAKGRGHGRGEDGAPIYLGVNGPKEGTVEHPITAAATPLAQAWDGYGTALKPAYEPIILARKPLIGTMVENVTAWGVGGIDIDGTRVGEAGRWPANLLLDETAAAVLDASVAPTKSPKAYRPKRRDLDPGAVPIAPRSEHEPEQGYGDSGGPSMFFYCAKVSTKERELGCEALPARTGPEIHDRPEESAGLANPRAGAASKGARNHHPTLKPLALTRWLATLIKPPGEGATLLVPFSGAGSEMIGALQAGWPAVFGIEGEQEYIAIAEARIMARREEAAK